MTCKKMFDKSTALSYAWIKMTDDTVQYRSSVGKWDAYSRDFGVKKLKAYIMRTFRESQVKMVVIYDNFTREEIDRMMPGTSSWCDLLPVRKTVQPHNSQSYGSTNQGLHQQGHTGHNVR